MSTPERIQLRRTKGWRMPAHTVPVARPGKWGNPFVVSDLPVGSLLNERRGTIAVATASDAVAAYRAFLIDTLEGRALANEARRLLRGLSLACWCPIGSPCHADVLLKIANEVQS